MEQTNRLTEVNGVISPVMPTPDERVQACLAEINDACERWACRLQTVFTVVDNMPNSSINVVPK